MAESTVTLLVKVRTRGINQEHLDEQLAMFINLLERLDCEVTITEVEEPSVSGTVT